MIRRGAAAAAAELTARERPATRWRQVGGLFGTSGYSSAWAYSDCRRATQRLCAFFSRVVSISAASDEEITVRRKGVNAVGINFQ